jgi:hypothetical protein
MLSVFYADGKGSYDLLPTGVTAFSGLWTALRESLSTSLSPSVKFKGPVLLLLEYPRLLPTTVFGT